MSVFYCEACQKVEDSDFVGYEVIDLGDRGAEVCSDGAEDHRAIVTLQERLVSQNDTVDNPAKL